MERLGARQPLRLDERGVERIARPSQTVTLAPFASQRGVERLHTVSREGAQKLGHRSDALPARALRTVAREREGH